MAAKVLKSSARADQILDLKQRWEQEHPARQDSCHTWAEGSPYARPFEWECSGCVHLRWLTPTLKQSVDFDMSSFAFNISTNLGMLLRPGKSS